MSSKKNGSRTRTKASNGLNNLLDKIKPPETTDVPTTPSECIDVPDAYRSILKGLRTEHVQFVLQMVRPRNPSIGAAYAKVYPTCKRTSAFACGSKLLQKVEISGAIEKIRGMMIERVAKRLEVNEEKLVAEMAKIAYVDAGEYGIWDKNTLILTSSEDLPPELTAAIESVRRVETAEGVRVEVKFHDKKGALDSLFRYKGLFKDKTEVKFTDFDALMAKIDGKSRGLPGEQAKPQGTDHVQTPA